MAYMTNAQIDELRRERSGYSLHCDDDEDEYITFDKIQEIESLLDNTKPPKKRQNLGSKINEK